MGPFRCSGQRGLTQKFSIYYRKIEEKPRIKIIEEVGNLNGVLYFMVAIHGLSISSDEEKALHRAINPAPQFRIYKQI